MIAKAYCSLVMTIPYIVVSLGIRIKIVIVIVLNLFERSVFLMRALREIYQRVENQNKIRLTLFKLSGAH